MEITFPSLWRRYHDPQRVKTESMNRAWILLLYSLFASGVTSMDNIERSRTGLINLMMYFNLIIVKTKDLRLGKAAHLDLTKRYDGCISSSSVWSYILISALT